MFFEVLGVKEIIITGGNRLYGELDIQGSKNAVLPIMAAAILNKGMTVIHNCPQIADVLYMSAILRDIGCFVTQDRNTIAIDASSIDRNAPNVLLMNKLRASILLMGAMVGRLSEVHIPYPGGCVIGERPVDMHITSMKALGCEVQENGEKIDIKVNKLVGNTIEFKNRSVGATQNAILAGVLADGITVIKNAATEPEVIQLCDCLNCMGANICGIGTGIVKIIGVKSLHDVVFRVESDRIVAGTYMLATVAAGGNVTLCKAPVNQMQSTILRVRQMGANITSKENAIYIEANSPLQGIKMLKTKTYPGFPTDMQSQIMSVLTLAKGRSIIREEIFERRFGIVEELLKMGARIIVDDNMAVIDGVEYLVGKKVCAKDLRGGAALVIAGLSAIGETIVCNTEYISRGYVDICKDMKVLGARIKWKTIENEKV